MYFSVDLVESGYRRMFYIERERNHRRKKRTKKRKKWKRRYGLRESAIHRKSHRITEFLRLEGTSGGHPVQTSSHRGIN